VLKARPRPQLALRRRPPLPPGLHHGRRTGRPLADPAPASSPASPPAARARKGPPSHGARSRRSPGSGPPLARWGRAHRRGQRADRTECLAAAPARLLRDL